MPFFETIGMLPDDPSLSLPSAFAFDPRKRKVNLASCDYLDTNGSPVTFSCARKAEMMLTGKGVNHDALPLEGHKEYIQSTLKLLLGENSPVIAAEEVFGIQTLGGTHALSIAAEFLSHQIKSSLYLSSPTWQEHKSILSQGGLSTKQYSYYDSLHHCLDFPALCQSIEKMEPGAVIVLQACCHNPTGFDPSKEQWKELSTLIKKQKLLPLFDVAYQGMGHGLEEDVWPIRYFVEQQHEVIIAYTFSKNMELLYERLGLLAFVTHNKETVHRIKSQVRSIMRHHYASPPSFGANVIASILNTPTLKMEWEKELESMRDRFSDLRRSLLSHLQSKGVEKDFSFLNQQCGMFSFCGLDRSQVHRLRQENGIYIPLNGNINIAGLNWQNIDYVTEAVLTVLSA